MNSFSPFFTLPGLLSVLSNRGSDVALQNVDTGSPEPVWTSSLFHVVVTGTVLPGCLLVVLLLNDVLCSEHTPKPIYRVFQTLKRPFNDFLSLEDLEGPVGEPVVIPIWKQRILASGAAFVSIGWAAYVAYTESVYSPTDARSVEAIVNFVSWSYVFLRSILITMRTPSYILILFFGFEALGALIDICVFAYNGSLSSGLLVLNTFRFAAPAHLAWLTGTYPLLHVWPSKNVAKPTDTPSNNLSMPEDNVDLWTWSTFNFVEPILNMANQRTLNEADVWWLSPFFMHKNLFNKYLEYCNRHPTHSLVWFLLASNSLDLILDVALEFWGAVVGFIPPYSLQQILSALADGSPNARIKAYTWTFMMFLANLSFAQVDVNQRWFTRRCYERTRGQLFCALHYKALKRRDISGKSAKNGSDENKDENEGADLGKIVNLMQGDAYAVAQRFWEFSAVFSAPLRLAIALTFLYRILGWSAFAGVAVVVVAYILNWPLAQYNIYVTRQSWKARDRRMNLVNELFQNIRFLKFYGWENGWASRVGDSRENELRWRVKDNIVSTVISFLWTWVPSATALASFVCYTMIAKERLTVSKAFTSVALFSQIQEPMSALPTQIFALLHAYVSMQRIDEFLKEAEVEDWASSLKSTTTTPSQDIDSGKVGFVDGVFEWDASPRDGPSRFTLGSLNTEFPCGKLTLVSGATGSGKSALLSALLGEMHCLSGRVMLNKSNHQVAYCAQNPWLEHATIRDNIIFGATFGFEEARYNRVIEACALVHDLAIFEAGDLTEIGEKGITLSGGQRARIALARALYSQASCVLLDDPLAAVDMHTAQHLVKNALSGPLASNRTFILVTHHITLCLPHAAYLVELSDGQIIRQGSIGDLEARGQLKELVAAEDLTEEKAHNAEGENAADTDDVILDEPDAKKPSNGKLIEAEARAEGRVALSTYVSYVKAAGPVSWLIIIFLMILIRFINIGNQFYLAKWGEAYEQDKSEGLSIFSTSSTKWFWETLPSPNVDARPWLLIYLYISLAGAFSVFAFIAIGYYASLQASRSLFISMLTRLVGAPARFYDVTPIGRILNRFTTDMNCVDGALLNSVRAALGGVLNFVASIAVIIYVVPSFAPFAVVIAWLYIRLAPPYIKAARDLRRLESISLSPAFAGFDELLRGLSHVRAFGMETRYQDRFYYRVDKFQSFDHVYWLAANWLMWRYDCLGSVIVFMSTVFALWAGVNDGLAALVIVQAGVFAEASRQLVRVLAQLELDANSVERVVEYLQVPQEAPAIIESNKPPAYWPSSNGELHVEELVVKYAQDLPPALRGISFTVKPTEKIGIVGRTGSGKSTLALSMLRMIEATQGRIIIDGIDIATLGLADLRTRVTIISQDVSLFAGTLRSNLDPFDEHTDEECWEVIERCHLASVLGHTKNGTDTQISLDMPISQTGSLSAGERQLVAMARALLRRSNVVILDEATSQIDIALDDQIQRTIREEFRGAIVITIAHRLKTVLDYDRILVLGGGEILEFDTPRTLLRKRGGTFRDMCRASADWSSLQEFMDEHEG